jgi:hypothetical protein
MEVAMAETNGTLHDATASDDEQARREREERAWRVVEEIQARNAHISPDEILAEVTSEVEAIRQEMYEQRQRAKSGRS